MKNSREGPRSVSNIYRWTTIPTFTRLVPPVLDNLRYPCTQIRNRACISQHLRTGSHMLVGTILMLWCWLPCATLPREKPPRGAGRNDRKHAECVPQPQPPRSLVLFHNLRKYIP